MNGKDYLEWWNYHIAVLPSIGKWFDGLDDAEPIHNSWMAALATTSLKDACAATDAIVAGTIERPYPEETAAVVRLFAAELALSRRTVEPEPDGDGRECGLCRSTGHVTIWHPLIAKGVYTGANAFRAPGGELFFVRNRIKRIVTDDLTGEQFERLEFGDVRRLTAAVPCNCQAGNKFATRSVKRGDHYEREDVRRYTPAFFHARVTDRSFEERKQMTVDEQVAADLELAGLSKEWVF